MSISSWTRERLFSSTIMAKTEVPAETLPVRGRTALVATMPVPASPSGGQNGMPAASLPVGIEQPCPLGGELPGRPAGREHLGEDVAQLPAELARRDQGVELLDHASASQSQVAGSIGNMPEASPTPISFSPVSFQWT